MTTEELAALGQSLIAIHDDRPQILKDLTAAAPTTELYNKFLYQLSKKLKPQNILETGTDRGRSAAHLALGNPDAVVVTIDIDPACKANVDSLKIRNIVSVAGNSLEYVSGIPDYSIELLFLDSLHTYEHTIAEWHAFRPKVAPGGLVFFDDIHLDPGMERFWSEVEGEKVDLSPLHYSGFGALVV